VEARRAGTNLSDLLEDSEAIIDFNGSELVFFVNIDMDSDSVEIRRGMSDYALIATLEPIPRKTNAEA